MALRRESSGMRERLEADIAEGGLLATLENDRLRDSLGRMETRAKTFLKNLTRFHRLKRALDTVAERILSDLFLSNERYATQASQDPPMQAPGDVDAQLRAAAEAEGPTLGLIKRAVEAAGLRADSQPNIFIEKSVHRDDLYTSATMGPLKKRERVVEKVDAEYGGDERRCVDIARATIVVDTERELIAVFEALLGDGSATVVRLKNRFAAPSFNGYRDALFNIRVPLESGASHVVEVQVHLSPILERKAEAHTYYDFFRRHFHGNMSSCDDCMRMLDRVVGGTAPFSVRLLEDAAASSDLELLLTLGDLFEHRCSQYGIALIFRKRFCAVEAQRSGGVGPQLAAALRALAVLQRKVGHYEEAARCSTHALEVNRAALAQPIVVLGPELAAGLCDHGMLLVDQGKTAEARAALLESLKIYDDVVGDDDAAATLASKPGNAWTGKGWTLLRLATLHKDMADFEAALDFADRTARIWVQDGTGGRHEGRYAHVLVVRGDILQHLGRIAESGADYARAFEIRRRSAGVEHPDTAKALRKLGTALRYQGDLAAAAEKYDASLNIFYKSFGDDLIDTIKCKSDRAELALSQGDHALASRLGGAARAAAVRLFGEGLDHICVRESTVILGTCASLRGDHAAALATLRPAADAEAELGMPPRFKAAVLLAEARKLRDEGQDASDAARDALAILDATFRPEDEKAVARAMVG